MSVSSQFSVPEGYYPPFAVISDDDHEGWIINCDRPGIYVKILSRQQGGLDDVLLAIGTIFAFAQQSVVLAACSKGLGRSVDLLSASELRNVEKSFYTSQLLTILALGFCKCSLAYFILRLTPQISVRKALHVFLACTSAWMFGSILALALQCDLSSPWSLASGACEGVYRRVLAIGIIDMIPELALFGCAILLVSRLQTKLFKKIMVVTAFGLRLPIIAFIIARLTTFDADMIEDFARSETLYIVWTVTQINFSLISTTLPILRPLIKDLSTFYGALRPSEYGSNDASRSNSYPLSNFRVKRSDATQRSHQKMSLERSSAKDGFNSIDFGRPLHPLEPTTHTEIEAIGGPSRLADVATESESSLGSVESQRMVIQVNTEWEVSRGSPLPV
ncbi:hypothetical protein Slin14017_G000950 [Septoria linicola]|nr:hypothetical protein Slin14017_G000950 [Septoria linicola]